MDIGEDLIRYAEYNNELKLRELITNHHETIDINYQNKSGSTALIQAVHYGREAIVKVLLNDPRCDVNIRDKYGSTALMIAQVKKHTKNI